MTVDPDATLAGALSAAARIAEGKGTALDAAVLADGALALDAWILGGGYVPRRWDDAPRTRRARR